jgi:hypothetical protein
MAKKIKITENQLKRLIAKQKMISEQPDTGGQVDFDTDKNSQFSTGTMNEHEGQEKHYMFFNSLEEIKRKSELLLNKIDHDMMDRLLEEHDWAAAHITVADNNLSQVFDFFMNKAKGENVDKEDDEANSHDKGMDFDEDEDEDEDEDKEKDDDKDMMNKNIKGDKDEEEEDEDKEEEDDKELNESIKKIKANFQRFL